MKRKKNSRGETLIDALMSHVFPIVGGTIGIYVVRHLTGWHFAFCVPVGFVAGVLTIWGVFFGIIAVADRIIKPKKPANQPSQPIAGKPGSG